MPKAISLSVSTLKNCVRGFWNTLPTHSGMRYRRYTTSSRFAELFRKNTGILPIEYRKLARREASQLQRQET